MYVVWYVLLKSSLSFPPLSRASVPYAPRTAAGSAETLQINKRDSAARRDEKE